VAAELPLALLGIEARIDGVEDLGDAVSREELVVIELGERPGVALLARARGGERALERRPAERRVPREGAGLVSVGNADRND
jgi:hypothetical protein